MTTVRLTLVALAGVLLSLLAPTAAQAVDYPDPICTITVDPQDVVGGEPVTVTVTSDPADDLSITFGNETRSEDDTTELSETFQTPEVTSPTEVTVTATCGGVTRSTTVTLDAAGSGDGDGGGSGDSDGGGAGNGAGDAGGDLTGSGSGDGLSGLLPNTGGPAFWLLLLAVLLALAGGTVALRRRES